MLYAFNDECAFYLLRALRERDIRVPQEIAIVGTDDLPSCELTRPSLTSLNRKQLAKQRQFRPEHDYLAPLTCPGNREAFHRSAISSPVLQLPATVSRKVRHHRAADHTPP